MRNPFRYFNSSPEVIRLAVMMYIRYPLSLRQVEDLLRALDVTMKRYGRCGLAGAVSLMRTSLQSTRRGDAQAAS